MDASKYISATSPPAPPVPFAQEPLTFLMFLQNQSGRM
nr:MAG TPA: hypothetical protein [Caudoviricetes sp.]